MNKKESRSLIELRDTKGEFVKYVFSKEKGDCVGKIIKEEEGDYLFKSVICSRARKLGKGKFLKEIAEELIKLNY